MSDVYEIKSPFLRQAIEQRGIMDDLVTDLLIVERYLRHPERTDAVAALMLSYLLRIAAGVEPDAASGPLLQWLRTWSDMESAVTDFWTPRPPRS